MATKYRNAVRSVYSNYWAILPEKLAAIAEVVDLRASGARLSKQEIAARLGQTSRQAAQGSGSVAVLNLFGTIAHHGGQMAQSSGVLSVDVVGAAFDRAVSDPNISTIVLNVDSPGGTVAGTIELADKIYAARTKKRVIGVVNSLAASGGLWIVTACGEVVMTPSGMMGSIGVLSFHIDTTKQDEQRGIKRTIVWRGDYKAEGWLPITEEAKAAMQLIVDQNYDRFTAAVAKHRGVTQAVVERDFGKGRMMTAADALKVGLVDRIGSLDEVLSELGVARAASARDDAPAFPLEGISMHKNVFGALVRIGMCEITATTAMAEEALDRFYAVKGKDKPSSDDAIVADLKAHIDAKSRDTAGTPIPGTVLEAVADDRAEQILAAVKLANLPNAMDLVTELVADKKLSVADAMKKIQAKAVEHRKPSGATVETGPAERDKFVTNARSALLSRTFSGAAPAQIFDRFSQEYVDYKPVRADYQLRSLPRLAERCLIMDGYAPEMVARLTPDQIAQVAIGVTSPASFGIHASAAPYNTTGTFANLMLDAAHVTMRKSYDEAKTTYQIWAKKADDITDFKDINRVIPGEIDDPRVVPEGGEFEESTMVDGKEKYALRVWGRIFSISWQAIVNDQLGAFTAIPKKQSKSMKRKENKLVYGVLKDNAALSDGGALFNSTAVTSTGGHANLTTGAGAPSVSTLNALALKMAQQKGLDPNVSSPLGLMARFILAGFALRGTILELLGSTSYAQANGNSGVKNIWENGLTPVLDEELGLSGGGSDTQWILATDSDEQETVEYAHLQGMESPQLDSQPDFRRLALTYRMFKPFAAKAIDFRGLQKHAGA